MKVGIGSERMRVLRERRGKWLDSYFTIYIFVEVSEGVW